MFDGRNFKKKDTPRKTNSWFTWKSPQNEEEIHLEIIHLHFCSFKTLVFSGWEAPYLGYGLPPYVESEGLGWNPRTWWSLASREGAMACWCFRIPIPNHRLDGAKNRRK